MRALQRLGVVLALGFGAIGGSEAVAQQSAPATEAEAQELAKQLSNPVANLVSVPFQYNWDSGVGPEDGTRFLLNIQPVVPFGISEKWNLIGRFIVPILGQPALVPGGEATFGTSDIVASAFLSPAVVKGVFWGVGPVFAFPTTTDPFLGSGKWSAGPTFAVLKQSGPWTVGALANHLWSFAEATDEPRPDVDQTLLQPFLTFATRTGVTYSLNLEAVANWEAPSGEEWTIPINLAVSKLTKFGPFPFQIGVGGGYYVEKPEGGPDWKLRLSFTLILPRGK